MAKKQTEEFMDGLYPERAMRQERIKEIKSELDVLIENRKGLDRQINALLYEGRILEDLDRLQKYSRGEIDIELRAQNDSTDQS